MKRNTLTIFIGALLIVLFALLLFTFQVRETEVAMVTTFDRPTVPITEPGLKWKWPQPIQKVYKFDKRIQNFEEDKLEETLTRDNINLLVQVYAGWTISDPVRFFNSFPRGTVQSAEPALGGLIRSAKNAAVGKHPFTSFVSTNPEELKFVEIEDEILAQIQPFALANYGIDVQFVGFKKLRLPESVTETVFERMKSERQSHVQGLQAEGESRAMTIRNQADLERRQILDEAEAEAVRIRGEADSQAAKYFEVFEQEPELAILLRSLAVLEETLKAKTTLIFDENTPPFNLMKPQPGRAPLLPVASPIEGTYTTSANE